MSSVDVVGAVEVVVADHVGGDAHALEAGAGPLAGLARDLGRAAGVFRRLVGAVAAVVLAVADERLVDAVAVVTLEVVGLAVDAATARRLVGLVLAVDGAVALPADRDADAGSLASGRRRGGMSFSGLLVMVTAKACSGSVT